MTDDNQNNLIESIIKFFILIYKIICAYIDSCLNLFRKPTKKCIKGQNVLITGSGHGLGREIALRLAGLGVNLALVDINESNNEKVKQEILDKYQKGKQRGGGGGGVTSGNQLRVFAYSADIRDESKVAKLAKQVEQDLGNIDILINNAGIVQCMPFLELEPELVERTLQVNTLAHIWTIRHFLPNMIKNNRGHIVAIASVAGLIGSKYLTDYCASKFAVVGLMDSLDNELHEEGHHRSIHLTTVCPVSMSTGMFHSFRTRFNWLLPILNAGQVADDIVYAILTNKRQIVVPPMALFLYKLSSVLPTRVSQLIQEYLDYGVKPHAN